MAGSKARTRPFVLGLTGNIACGKSTVLAMLADLGATTIDADQVYHELIVPDAPLWQVLRDAFGETILGPDRTIDRRALGAIVFSDPAALAKLDALTHPAVETALRERVRAASTPVVVVDAVKLIESGFANACDRVWLVICDPAWQLERLQQRNHLSQDEAARRIAAQPPLEPKLVRADTVIDNSGDIAATRRQVEAAWRELPVTKPMERSR